MKSHRIAFIIAIAAFALLAVCLFPACAIPLGKGGKHGRIVVEPRVYYLPPADLSATPDAPVDFKEVR